MCHQPHPLFPHVLTHVKLEVSRCDGHDPLGWIFKISQFFEYQGTPEEERITVVSFYMDGPTLSWFQWSHRNSFITPWPEFLQVLETRFAPTYYDKSKGALFKLSQWGTVNEYLTEFECLANHINGLPLPFLLICFIFSLSPKIRQEVQALQPISLPQTTALAKLQEDFLDRRRSYKTPTSYNPSPSPSSVTPTTFNILQPFVHHTSNEMALHREKGLCYDCDEKWNLPPQMPRSHSLTYLGAR